jgi:hypothetical protein
VGQGALHKLLCDRRTNLEEFLTSCNQLQASSFQSHDDSKHSAPLLSPCDSIQVRYAINQSIKVNVTSVAMRFIENSCQPFAENHLFGCD